MIVDKKTFADIIGVSPRMVTNYIEEGLPVVGGGGRGVAVQIETAAALKWLQQRAIDKEVGANGDDEGKGTKAWEERRLAKIKADRQEFAHAKDQGLHPHIDQVKQVLFEVSAAFGNSLDSIGARLAGELAAESDPAVIRQKLFEESRRIRKATADVLRNWVASARTVTAEQIDDDEDQAD